MSTRRHQKGGWVDSRELPKGPNGRSLCRQCGQEVPKGFRTFCGNQCVSEWRTRTDAGFARLMVFQRDKGVCAVCFVDVFSQSGRTPRSSGSGDLWQADHIKPVVEGGGECGLENLRTLCTGCHKAATAALRKRLVKPRGQSIFDFAGKLTKSIGNS